MERLKKDWITDDVIDFEYKKYLLLAYLQHVEKSFSDIRLYPPLSDLIMHYRSAKALKEDKQNLIASFPKRIKNIDPKNFKLHFESSVNETDLLAEIDSIIDYSLPRIAGYVEEGRKIFDFIEKGMGFHSVGLLPLNTDAGYVFLKDASGSTIVYAYELTIFEQPEARFRGIHTYYVCDYAGSLVHTFESIKSDLLRINRKLPNPAVFAAETDMELPLEETFLPIVKRRLVRYIAEAA